MSKQPEMPTGPDYIFTCCGMLSVIFGSENIKYGMYSSKQPEGKTEKYIRTNLYDQLEREAQQLADALEAIEKRGKGNSGSAVTTPRLLQEIAAKALTAWNARKDKTT